MSTPEEAFADDPSIADGDNLLRRIPSVPRMVAREGDGTLRVTSAALIRKGERGCSVSVQSRLANSADPLAVLIGFSETWGLAGCSAGSARNHGEHNVVGRPEEDNAAHAEVIPTAPSRKAQKRSLKALAMRMNVIREPTFCGQNAGRCD